MRCLLSFPCEGDLLGATLDGAAGSTGILLVTGGSQTRVGSHRMFERLAAGLGAAGYPCFRFDRRGVGDSEGEDSDFRGSGPDLKAAAAAFRAHIPDVERLIGFGLCDGATALALFGDEAGLDGLILANAWLVESQSGEPPPAAIRSHYRRQLLSLEGWRRLITGSVSIGKILKGLRKIAAGGQSDLASDVAASLARHRLPVELIHASEDATATAAEHELKSAQFKGLIREPHCISSNSHTFAKPGDAEALLAATLAAIGRLDA